MKSCRATKISTTISTAAALSWKIQTEFVRHFIASHVVPPAELILDFDASDIPRHGNQEERFFRGYYDNYCYLPLYVFCDDQLLVSYLRPSKLDAAKHAGAILKWLTVQLRAAWPDVRIIFRGDSGFCRRKLLHWCEGNGVDYVVGLAKNARLVNGDLKLTHFPRRSRRWPRT